MHNSSRPCEKSGVRPFTMYVSRALMDFCCRGLESRLALSLVIVTPLAAVLLVSLSLSLALEL